MGGFPLNHAEKEGAEPQQKCACAVTRRVALESSLGRPCGYKMAFSTQDTPETHGANHADLRA